MAEPNLNKLKETAVLG